MAMVRLFTIPLATFMCLPAFAQDAPRFNRDVRPILSDKCFACHGPDSAKRKAGLRLDSLEGALQGAALVPGDAAASAIIQRITTDNPDDRMPPPDSELSLTPEEIDTLTRWVATGAEYQPHWAFVPPAIIPVRPGFLKGSLPRHRIDARVHERLAAEGLSPAPEAPRATWLRRVTFDLTGLPPTPDDIFAFLSDKSPAAHETVVDRLLASAAYGEHMAVGWLDAARYADTFGYQADVPMDMWPWRDWVIRAFNGNLPYDRFLTWQIAGDLLPTTTQEQRLATGFNRLHRQTNEGGSINEEFRQAYIGDRVETFATATMGLTFNCARCHDHKYDPISQRDYYSLAAFFANIDESGLYSHFTHTAPTPVMLLYGPRQQERYEMLKRRIARLEEALTISEQTSELHDFERWNGDPEQKLENAVPVLSLAFDAAENNATPDAAAPQRPATFIAAPQLVEGRTGKAMAFTGDDGVQSEGAAAFDRCDPFTIAMWLKVDKHIPKAVVVHRCEAESDAASRGYEVMLDEGRPVFSLIHFWPGNAIRVRALQPMAEGEWVHLAVRYDGSSRAAGAEVFLNGERADVETIRDNLYKTILYEGDPKVPFTVAQRFRDSGLRGGAIDALKVFDSCLSPLEIAALARDLSVNEHWPHATDWEQREHFRRLTAQEAKAELHEARRKEAEFVERIPAVMVMEEMPQPKETRILARGEYDKPGDLVSADTPHSLPPFPSGAPRNRLGLAQWLTDARHPLTARVAVNRLWQQFFGRGLVETQEDFGNQGKTPSHPELLDYLAVHFVESGWDVKALCREIVLSGTYRQDSAASEGLRSRDPGNVLLARGPSFRMSAEQIRDAALAASGLLVAKVGGPSVKPYQPAGLWEDASSQSYSQDNGEGLYRRSIYTFIKRTVPPPSVVTFDATGREVCVVRRERTITPLQALVLLNDPQYVEAARVLAEKHRTAYSGPWLEEMFLKLLGRHATSEELEVLSRAYEEQRAWYAARPEDAARYANTGDAPLAEGIDPVQLAAATAVAQALMNLDEFQVRR